MLAELIHPIAAMGYEEWPFKPRPSNAGPEHCLRKLAYQAHGTPQRDPGGRFLVVMDDSSWHEELIIQWIEKSAFQVHSRQMRIQCDTIQWNGGQFLIEGNIDGLVTNLFGDDRLLECKAIEHFTFTRYYEGAYPLNYFTQVAFYLVGVRRVNPDIKEALLLIKNKNQSAFLEYRLDYDADQDVLTVLEVTHSTGQRTFPNQAFIGLRKQSLQRYAQLEDHRLNRTLPHRPYEDDDNYHCGYCPFKTRCWANVEVLPKQPHMRIREDLVPLLQEYQELAPKRASIEKRYQELRKIFQLELTAHHAAQASGHGFLIRNKHKVVKRLQKDLLPKPLVERSTIPKDEYTLEVVSFYEEDASAESTKVPDPIVLAS